MNRRTFVAMAAAQLGLLGGGAGVCSTARAQRVDQIWTETFPTSPPAGQWDAPVGVGVSSGPRVFVGGTRTYSTGPTASAVAIAKYDLDHNLIDSKRWPTHFASGLPSDYTAVAMAVHPSASSEYSLIAITGTHHKSDGHLECFTLAYHNDNSTDELTLAGSATLDVSDSTDVDVTPVAIGISPNGLGIGVLVQVDAGSDHTIATVLYSATDMSQSNLWTYSPTTNDTPAAIALTDDTVIVAGTSPHPGASTRSDMLIMVFPSQGTPGAPAYMGRTNPSSGESDMARALAVAIDGNTGEPFSDGHYFVAGLRVNSSGKSDFLTAAFGTDPCQTYCYPAWTDTAGDSEKDELATAAVAFHLAGQGDLDGGNYVYVTGIADATTGSGNDIFTKLYYDTGGISHVDRWPAGARWDGAGHLDDEAAAITLTSTDTTGAYKNTRAIVQGWTTSNSSGDVKFVAIKYDAEPTDTQQNPPPLKDFKWAKIQESPTSGQHAGYAIVHKMITDNGQPYLNFFSVGASLDSTSGSDFRTFRFKEVCETGSCGP